MLPWPNNPLHSNRSKPRLRPGGFVSIGVFVVLVLWFGLLGWAALNRQNIFDWWQLEHYQAPAAVSQLAAQDTLTNYAHKVFYVNRPSLDDKTTFASVCPNNGGEQTIVLGCYHSSQAGIFLLNVSDPRLNGVEQVTAAHEMLHAAYDRLSSSERHKVDGWLMDYYQHGLHDQRVLDTIAAYQKSEPNDWVNEMHSVFGTEVASLPSNLETYYQRYFTDRSQVTTYVANYQAEFTSRQAAVARDDAQLATLKAQIASTEADLQAKQTAINNEQSRLMGLKTSQDIEAYNAGVPAYNQRVDTYNTEVNALQAMIDQYNQLVASRNAIALEQNQLVKELTTNVAPINH